MLALVGLAAPVVVGGDEAVANLVVTAEVVGAIVIVGIVDATVVDPGMELLMVNRAE